MLIVGMTLGPQHLQGVHNHTNLVLVNIMVPQVSHWHDRNKQNYDVLMMGAQSKR